ncbi:MAG: hypothetical protein EOP83_18980, partial [Verrucomicrobiaceae bacterium]
MDAYAVQFRRGTSIDHDNFTGKDGELTVDTTTWTVRVHDGVTPGGHNAARVDLGNVNLTDLRDRMNAIGDGSDFVRLDPQGRLPAIDGSQLTNLPGTDYETIKKQIIQDLIDQGLFGDNMPSIGSTKMGYISPGDDYITANGAIYQRSDYPDLSASIGERFNIESGTYQFYWPVIGYDLINQNIQDAAVNNGIIATVGNNGGGCWRSADDGRSWFRAMTSATTLSAITSGKGLFVAVGANGAIVTSTNGLVWTPRTSGTTAALTQVSMVNNTFVATGANGTLCVSLDGVTWVSSTVSAFAGQTINVIGYAFGNYVLAGTAGILLTSSD